MILVGAIFCIVFGIVICGGIKRIASIAEYMAPVMCVIYVVMAVSIIVMKIGQVPGVLKMIVTSAFGLHPLFGGVLGSAISWGVKRGIYFKQAVVRAVGWNFTGNELVDTLLVHIHEHFDQKMELSALSELVYCSESHMTRVFKKHMGMSIISYVHKIRIEKSIKMLLENGSVKETAEAVGYQNLNHFYKYFNQYMGMAPAAYIRKRRENYGKDG